MKVLTQTKLSMFNLTQEKKMHLFKRVAKITFRLAHIGSKGELTITIPMNEISDLHECYNSRGQFIYTSIKDKHNRSLKDVSHRRMAIGAAIKEVEQTGKDFDLAAQEPLETLKIIAREAGITPGSLFKALLSSTEAEVAALSLQPSEKADLIEILRNSPAP